VAAPPKSGRPGDLHNAATAVSVVEANAQANAAKDRPHARAYTNSVEQRMGRGIMPKGLAELVAWFREVTAEELPVAIHRSGVWRDPGDGMVDKEAGKGSRLHSPEHTDPFIRFMAAIDEPSKLDPDGYYRYPVRACLSRYSRRHPLSARALYQLSLNGGDTRRLADLMCYPQEVMDKWMERSLHEFWKEFSEQRLRIA
jgi:hypothetical protein